MRKVSLTMYEIYNVHQRREFCIKNLYRHPLKADNKGIEKSKGEENTLEIHESRENQILIVVGYSIGVDTIR